MTPRCRPERSEGGHLGLASPFYIEGARQIGHAAKTMCLAALTPLLEKNVVKTLSLDVPLVFSMGRLIVLGFAAAMLRQIWLAGIAGWPDATLSIAVVLALPVMGALERVDPAKALDAARALLARFGAGAARAPGSVYQTEPRKFDDHRQD